MVHCRILLKLLVSFKIAQENHAFSSARTSRSTTILSANSPDLDGGKSDGQSLKERLEAANLDNDDSTEVSDRPTRLPELSSKGVYIIKSKEQHSDFLKAHPDKLVVMKFSASYCRACAALDPKFLAIRSSEKLAHLPIVWAEFGASKTTRAYFRRLDVLSLPSIQFYDGGQLVENFACGVAKIKLLQQKLAAFLNRRVDPQTFKLRVEQGPPPTSATESQPRYSREVRIGKELITQEHMDYLRTGLPFFRDLSQKEFDEMLSKARLQTYLPGDVIIRQGLPGTSFNVIKSGQCEMCIRSRFDDPISTPPWYLGAVVNQLGKFDYFGERALTTGEPYAASVRVLEKTRCFAFDVEDIPASCILSQQRIATEAMVEKLTERYILPDNYVRVPVRKTKDESILELLIRFKQIRQAAKCLEYVLQAEPLLGDAGEIARRALLVSKLSPAQRQDFVEVFQLVNSKDTGTITLLELRRFMEGALKKSSDRELVAMMQKASPGGHDVSADVGRGISLDEFLGVMAEAEFYNLFTEIFQDLDPDGTGYVRAGDLDQVLDGVRGLISDDRKSLIDTEDQDQQVDYEQFARMLLGAAL